MGVFRGLKSSFVSMVVLLVVSVSLPGAAVGKVSLRWLTPLDQVKATTEAPAQCPEEAQVVRRADAAIRQALEGQRPGQAPGQTNVAVRDVAARGVVRVLNSPGHLAYRLDFSSTAPTITQRRLESASCMELADAVVAFVTLLALPEFSPIGLPDGRSDVLLEKRAGIGTEAGAELARRSDAPVDKKPRRGLLELGLGWTGAAGGALGGVSDGRQDFGVEVGAYGNYAGNFAGLRIRGARGFAWWLPAGGVAPAGAEVELSDWSTSVSGCANWGGALGKWKLATCMGYRASRIAVRTRGISDPGEGAAWGRSVILDLGVGRLLARPIEGLDLGIRLSVFGARALRRVRVEVDNLGQVAATPGWFWGMRLTVLGSREINSTNSRKNEGGFP